MKPRFSDLYFGDSDAQMELRNSPDKFLASFIDPEDRLSDIISGRITLILGPKGTGKTALAAYLTRTGGPRASHAAVVKNARHLPLGDISRIKTGQPAGRNRTATVWRFILLTSYLDFVLNDPGASIRGIREIRRVITALRKAGFTGEASSALLQMQQKTFELSLENAGNLFRDLGNRSVGIFDLIPYLNQWAMEIKSEKRYIFLLDGLDSILLNDPKYDESLAGLLQASSDINFSLFEGSASGSVVLLLRNDVFSRAATLLPDAHKMRDEAYDLDWRSFSRGGAPQGPLLKLLNQKARQGLDEETDVDVLEYFPRLLPTSGRAKKAPRLQYLTNLTRHTPRDFLQLMEYIRRESAKRDSGSDHAVSSSAIHEGVVSYSSKYFVEAIKGEFAGYDPDPQVIHKALTALKLLDRNEFSRSDYLASLRARSPELVGRGDELLELFFRAGAIGNLFKGHGGYDLVFYHRRDDLELDPSGTLKLHNALMHAWSRAGSAR